MSSYLGNTKATSLSVGYGGPTWESYNEAKLTVNGGWLQIYNFGHTLNIGARDESWSYIQDSGSIYLYAVKLALHTDPYPFVTNTYNLGDSSHLWKGVYATNFYEGDTALSSKYQAKGDYVTTSTAQDISGRKTFVGGASISHLSTITQDTQGDAIFNGDVKLGPSTNPGGTVVSASQLNAQYKANSIIGANIVSGARDIFYCAWLRTDFFVYSMTIGGVSQSGAWSLFDGISTSGPYFSSSSYTVSDSSPIVIQICTGDDTNGYKFLDHTDVLTCMLHVHTLAKNTYYLTKYKVEVLCKPGYDATDPLPASQLSWYTIIDRSNVYDDVEGLTFRPDNESVIGSYYASFRGLRITIYGIKCASDGYFRLSSIQLLNQRGSGAPASAVGALPLAGGTVYGDVSIPHYLDVGTIRGTNLGTSSTRWSDGYLAQIHLYDSGPSGYWRVGQISSYCLGVTKPNGVVLAQSDYDNIYPGVTDSINFGISSRRWLGMYAKYYNVTSTNGTDAGVKFSNGLLFNANNNNGFIFQNTSANFMASIYDNIMYVDKDLVSINNGNLGSSAYPWKDIRANGTFYLTEGTVTADKTALSMSANGVAPVSLGVNITQDGSTTYTDGVITLQKGAESEGGGGLEKTTTLTVDEVNSGNTSALWPTTAGTIMTTGLLGNTTTMTTPSTSSATSGSASRNYYVGANSNGKLCVYVPWSTTYLASYVGTYVGSRSASSVTTLTTISGGSHGVLVVASGTSAATASFLIAGLSAGSSPTSTLTSTIACARPYMTNAIAELVFFVPAGRTFYLSCYGSWTYLRYGIFGFDD